MLIKPEELKQFKEIPCECLYCKKIFYINKSLARRALKGTKKVYTCSNKCKHRLKIKKQVVECKNCNSKFEKQLNEIKRSKNNFCSRSCAATYNNKNKTKGTRRSKLEIWLEEQLTQIFPKLEIHYNRKDAINSELDLYIPSLKIAFELNGIFHYEPIFGENKFEKIISNDYRKFQDCLEKQIELCIIDVSKLNYFKHNNAKKYLDIIFNIIQKKSHPENRTLLSKLQV